MTTQNQINATGPLLDGEIYIGATGAAAVAETITPGTGISIVNAANSITINATGVGLTWSTITAGTLAAAINNGYVLNHSATACVVTLPATAAEGSIIAFQGLAGSGGFTITANTGQTIQFGNTSTGSAGSLSSTNAGDTLWIVCGVANTTWLAISSISAGLTVV